MITGNRTLRILHISDFHCSDPPSPFHKRIVEELVADLGTVTEADGKIDLVFFTGDLTASGSQAQFAAATECLLDPISTATALAHAAILITPGNHDVHWPDIDPDSEAGLDRNLTDNPAAVAAFLADERRVDRSSERLQNFLAFEGEWYGDRVPSPSEPLGRSVEIDLGEAKIGVAIVNSAWRSSDTNDKDHLLVGERQIASCLEDIAQSDFRVVGFHHPLDWLQSHDSRSTQNWLQRRAHLVLTGHTHITDPFFKITPAGSTVYSGAGCLYESSEYLNAYSIVTVSLKTDSYSVDVDVHEYSPKSGFASVRRSPANRGLSIPDVPYTANQLAVSEQLPTPAIIGRYLAQLAESQSVIPQHIARRQPSRVTEIFVDPIFLSMPYAQLAKELGGKDHEKHHLDPEELLESNNCLAICGDHESGLTGALLWMLDKYPSVNVDAIPIYIDSSNLISGPSLVDRAIRHSLLDLGVSIGKTDQLPRVIVAIDNLQNLKGRQLEHVLNFRRNNPKHILVLGWHDERLRVSEQLTGLGIDHNICYLGPLGIPELRGIVKKLTPEADPQIAETILKILRSENLPRTPFVMTLLAILVAESNSQFDALSESILLDKYVTHLLEQAAGGQNSRVGFDPKNWSRILEYVAEQFRIGGLRFRSRLEVDAFVIEYFKSLTWGDSVLPIVEQLLEWRLLVQHGDQVGFWHPALIDIFLGRRINSEFLTASAEAGGSFTVRALKDPLRHARPIEHAAALAKGNRVILEKVAAFDEMTFGNRGRELGAVSFPNVGLSSGWAESHDMEPLVNQVKVEVPSAEERERIQIKSWEQFEASHADDVPPEDFGDEQKLDLIDELLATVRLFSSVLRSSEHMADADLKRRLLARSIEQWAGVALLMFVEEDLHKTSSALVKRILSAEDDGPKSREEAKDTAAFADRLVNLLIMVFVSIDMSESLGTRKMNELLADLLRDEEFVANPARALFGTVLYGELESERGEHWLILYEELFRQHRRFSVVLDMLMVVLQRFYHFGSIRERDRDRLASLIAEVVLDVNGVRERGQRARAKSVLIEQLHHQSLLSRPKEE